ncbi:MAG: NADH-ubiquinone oxidoreductase-F iron-sulfur binding region domain-containing protein [Candidatus Omnitrophica bacterium]|nr:NADH-ubiquinone oxidoreductase-F iron-sulfur binding region domain-containing protein [Candidatus Omnitrophota bacterium]
MPEKRKGAVIFSEIIPYAGLKKAIELGRAGVLSRIRDSGLRGRGGAGFPAGIKLNLVSAARSEKKYVVCNADEGEPGTFKDRVMLLEYPRLIFEGMAIAAFASGADTGFLYLRGEYKSFTGFLEGVLEGMRKENALGMSIMGRQGFDFDIEIKLGSGAYVCGEETALIESLEGCRGEPRNRPPFPVNTGYNGYPTVLNNVETFSNFAHIVEKGADWFKSFGTAKSTGTKLLSVSGDCKRPGVYEVEFGSDIKSILKIAGGENAKAVSAGASGEIVARRHFSRAVCFEDFSTGGSLIVFSKERRMLEVVENFLRFFKDESCGQCTPCREGIPVLLEGLNMIRNGLCSKKYLDELLSLSETMQTASKCGLGQSCPKPFISAIGHFKREYKLSKAVEKEKEFHG